MMSATSQVFRKLNDQRSQVASAHYCFCVCTQVINRKLIKTKSKIKFRSQLENFPLLPNLKHGHSNQHSGQVQQAQILKFSSFY